jgi:hypothetical protein
MHRQSKSSLRGSPTSGRAVDDDPANGRYSLAHELAVALMPEPTSGSKLLAEEFGIEYDEGAEGIDDEDTRENVRDGTRVAVDSRSPYSDNWHSQSTLVDTQPDTSGDGEPLEYENAVASAPITPQQKTFPAEDALTLFALDLECTDKFLSHLRRLDIDSGSSLSQPALEKITSDVIRRMNDTTRDREGQVRELLEYEREFRKIAGEVGGSDVLSQLEELPQQDTPSEQATVAQRPHERLESIDEEETSDDLSNHWETHVDHNHAGDDEDEIVEPLTPSLPTDTFSHPPPVNGPPTAANSIPQLAHLRSFTTSLVTSLSTISEQAQVNGAATTEAGRKIRALKNKLGGWRTDWDNAERSRVKIEKWEAGIMDGESIEDTVVSPLLSPRARRVDGRRVVEEHLQAFEQALTDAGLKTQAIMAS